MQENPEVQNNLPLRGINVFEFGSNVAAPYAAWILAEMGATVTKIERPEGDDARFWGPPFWHGSSTIFHAINRNKTSIFVDLKNADEVKQLRERIVDEGDVVVQNLRPGVATKLGVGPESLMAENDRLIYCNLHAFGAQGPMKSQPGYDGLVQAFGGIISVIGEDGSPPARAGISIIDMGTGMWCAIGIQAALYQRTITGKGGLIDASLFETALAWMTYHAVSYQVTGEQPARQGTGVRGIVPYQGYPCQDGFLIIAASNERLFVKFAQLLEHEEWLEDERFSSNPKRVENREVLNTIIEAILKTKPRAHWQEKLDAAGIPNAPIQSVGEVLAHPQTKAIGMAQPTDNGDMNLLGLPLSFNGQRPPLRNLATPLPFLWKKKR